jgi:hypothetical protein
MFKFLRCLDGCFGRSCGLLTRVIWIVPLWIRDRYGLKNDVVGPLARSLGVEVIEPIVGLMRFDSAPKSLVLNRSTSHNERIRSVGKGVGRDVDYDSVGF